MRTRNVVIALGGGLLLTGGVSLSSWRPDRIEDAPSWAVVGAEVPAVELRSLDGVGVTLPEAVAGRPTVVYVMNRAACLDCTAVPTEIRALRRSHPGLHHLFIGVGPDTSFFAAYATEERIRAITLLDSDGRLHRALRQRVGVPFVLIVDAEGRIVHVDPRSGAAYSPFGTSRVVAALTSLLRDATDPSRPSDPVAPPATGAPPQ